MSQIDPRPPAADGERDLPEEIVKAIEELMRQSRGWYCAPEAWEVVQAKEALTTSILSRLTAAEAGREEALQDSAEMLGLVRKHVVDDEAGLLLDVLLVHAEHAWHRWHVALQLLGGVILEDPLDLLGIDAVDLGCLIERPLDGILLDAPEQLFGHVVAGVDVGQALVHRLAAFLALEPLTVDLDEHGLPPVGLVAKAHSLPAVLHEVDQQAALPLRRGPLAPRLDDQVVALFVVGDVLQVLQAKQIAQGCSPSAAPLRSFRFSTFDKASSTASRMNTARRNLPATASMRSSTPALKRTNVLSSSLFFGTATVVTDIGFRVKTAPNQISLVDPCPMSD